VSAASLQRSMLILMIVAIGAVAIEFVLMRKWGKEQVAQDLAEHGEELRRRRELR
jgi:hypothetical protein